MHYTIHINDLKYISKNLLFAEIFKINYILKIIKIKNKKKNKLNKSAISFLFIFKHSNLINDIK